MGHAAVPLRRRVQRGYPRMNDKSCAAVEPFGPLVQRALDGDQQAWSQLVERLNRLVWKVTLRYDLTAEERNDAFAATFLRLYENLGQVRETDRLPGWVSTVTRNEVLSILRSRRRFDAVVASQHPAPAESAEDSFDDEVDLRAALRTALGDLPPESQTLLRYLTADPPMAYSEIAVRLSMPIGAIGPTRQRILARLRRSPELTPYIDCRTS